MTRPARPHGSTPVGSGARPTDASDQQPDLPGARVSTAAPFVAQCRAVKIGNPHAKAIYINAATYVDQYPRSEKARALLEDYGEAVCWPGLGTLQADSELKRTAFMRWWGYLYEHGFIGTRQGSAEKVIRLPSAALKHGLQQPRSMPDGAKQRTPGWRTKGQEVPRDGTSKVPRDGTQHDQHTQNVLAPAASPVASSEGAARYRARGTGTGTASGRTVRQQTTSLDAPSLPDRDPDPEGLGKGEAAEPERPTRTPHPFDAMSADELAEATASALAEPAPAVVRPGRCPHCDAKVEGGAGCWRCSGSLLPDNWQPEPSADWNAGH